MRSAVASTGSDGDCAQHHTVALAVEFTVSTTLVARVSSTSYDSTNGDACAGGDDGCGIAGAAPP